MFFRCVKFYRLIIWDNDLTDIATLLVKFSSVDKCKEICFE